LQNTGKPCRSISSSSVMPSTEMVRDHRAAGPKRPLAPTASTHSRDIDEMVEAVSLTNRSKRPRVAVAALSTIVTAGSALNCSRSRATHAGCGSTLTTRAPIIRKMAVCSPMLAPTSNTRSPGPASAP
jgi:hypothetical protein